MEAVGLPDVTDEFRSDNPEIPFSYMVILHQDQSGGLPDSGDAVDYYEAIGEPEFPVTADPDAAVVSATPWNGNRLPGKCVLSPEMEMLECYTGDDDSDALDLIAGHFASR